MTVDLTKIATPFGLLDAETQEALQKWVHGVERFDDEGMWVETSPVWAASLTYRARPAPLVPDNIDWSHVAPEWKWMARDRNDEAFLFNKHPAPEAHKWHCGSGDCRTLDQFASYRRGTVACQDSLVKRPEGV